MPEVESLPQAMDEALIRVSHTALGPKWEITWQRMILASPGGLPLPQPVVVAMKPEEAIQLLTSAAGEVAGHIMKAREEEPKSTILLPGGGG